MLQLAIDVELRTMVQELLDRRLSPEQISQHLRHAFADQPERHLVPETIYVQGRGDCAASCIGPCALGGPCADLAERRWRAASSPTWCSLAGDGPPPRIQPGHRHGRLLHRWGTAREYPGPAVAGRHFDLSSGAGRSGSRSLASSRKRKYVSAL
ncbi:MAG TPA: hypothetical protein VEF72_07110, partial [Mycobacterium sp.]|nr:hypothetical protein [Mycobacterium sp.]